MSAKKPKPATKPASPSSKPAKRGFDARSGLGIYIEQPEKNPEGLVVEYDDDFVVINDKFPKARYALHIEDIVLYADSHSACISSSSLATQITTTNTRSHSSPLTPPSAPKSSNASPASSTSQRLNCAASTVATAPQTRLTKLHSKIS